MINFLACDLDGCLFDDTWRLNHIKHDAPNSRDKYHEYHGLQHQDTVIKETRTLINEHRNRANSCTAFWTARPEYMRTPTVQKIDDAFKSKKTRFYGMRMRQDNQEGIASPDLKSEWLVTLLEESGPNIETLTFIEDRWDILEAYRRTWIQAVLDSGWTRQTARFIQIVEGQVARDVTLDFKKAAELVARQKSNLDAALPLLQQGLTTIGDMREDVQAVTMVDAHTVLDDKPITKETAADILDGMAATFRERNAVYKDNYKVVGKVMAALFPNGIEIVTEEDHNFYHLFELAIVKLTRFTNSGMRHKDSIHDIAVYSAMLELLVNNHDIKIK